MMLFWRCGRSTLTSLTKIGRPPLLLDSRKCFANRLLLTPVHKQVALLHTTPYKLTDEEEQKRKPKWPFHLTMTEQQKEEKQQKIKQMKEEEEPKTMFGKIKYYLKRYWYIAVPAHMASSTLWFGGLYAAVHFGVDVIALLHFLHIPAAIIHKIENVPPSAGAVVVALLLYKVATPLRYATTLVFIQAAFTILRRMGKLRTVREVEYKVRAEYEKSKLKYGRKIYRFRNMGVRDSQRRSSHGFIRRDASDKPERKD